MNANGNLRETLSRKMEQHIGRTLRSEITVCSRCGKKASVA